MALIVGKIAVRPRNTGKTNGSMQRIYEGKNNIRYKILKDMQGIEQDNKCAVSHKTVTPLTPEQAQALRARFFGINNCFQ